MESVEKLSEEEPKTEETNKKDLFETVNNIYTVLNDILSILSSVDDEEKTEEKTEETKTEEEN